MYPAVVERAGQGNYGLIVDWQNGLTTVGVYIDHHIFPHRWNKLPIESCFTGVRNSRQIKIIVIKDLEDCVFEADYQENNIPKWQSQVTLLLQTGIFDTWPE